MASSQLVFAVAFAVLAAVYLADGRSVRSVSLRQTNSTDGNSTNSNSSQGNSSDSSAFQDSFAAGMNYLKNSGEAWAAWANETSLTNATQAVNALTKAANTTASIGNTYVKAVSDANTKLAQNVNNYFNQGLTGFFKLFG